MKTGLIVGESIADYHRADAFSNSRLKIFRKLPALYKAIFLDRTVVYKPASSAIDVGKALDVLLLDGVEEYAKQVYVLPETYRPGAKEDKALVASKEEAGFTVLTQKEASLVEEMAQTALRHPEASLLLEKGQPGATWRHDYGFAHGQARTDWWGPDGVDLPGIGHVGPYWVELKTCASLNSSDFINFRDEYANREYFLQIALYYEIMREILPKDVDPRVFFIVVDKGMIPYCQVFDPLATQRGREQFDSARRMVLRDVDALARCYTSGNWPGLPTGILPLELPVWKQKQIDKELE